jgi:hypothetical protein
MSGYYVEVWQPNGIEAEERGKFPTFEGAMDWIMSRKFDDATLVGCIFTSKPITPAQQTVVQRFGVRLEAASLVAV